jgi:malate dehydrogenase (oxaloacetate-decarboxylating)
VISGAGAAGIASTKILLAAGVSDITVADSRGIVHSGRFDLTPVKAELAAVTNRAGLTGSLADALVGADVFVGVSGGIVDEIAVAQMAPKAIVFALANPTPEVAPEVAHRHAAVVATGRSDLPNQINNVLAFPGIFAGAFDAGARTITENMKLAAAAAIGEVVAGELAVNRIVPTPFDPRVAPAVAAAVAAQAEADEVTAPTR